MSLDVDLTLARGDGSAGPAFSLQATFAVPSSGATVLFGASGAGKSTLVALLAGLLRPDAGHVRIDDEVLVDTRTETFLAPHERRLGVVFQEPRLFPHRSVRANLLYGRRRRGLAEDAEVTRIVELLGLGDLLTRRPHTLSGGEAQRVAIGRALLTQPRLLLLDEPFTGLDAPRRAEIILQLSRLRDELEVPIVYVTHRREEITQLADRVVQLDGGRIASNRTLEEALASADAAAALDDVPTSLLELQVDAHDEDYALTDLVGAGGRFCIERINAPRGASVRLGIRATDVTLARREPAELSANNVLQGSVTDLVYAGESWADVHLDCAGQRLIARVTRRSAQRLGVARGETLWALVKSTTLRV